MNGLLQKAKVTGIGIVFALQATVSSAEIVHDSENSFDDFSYQGKYAGSFQSFEEVSFVDKWKAASKGREALWGGLHRNRESSLVGFRVAGESVEEGQDGGLKVDVGYGKYKLADDKEQAFRFIVQFEY